MFEEIEIEWIPEDTGAPYEVDMTRVEIDTPAHISLISGVKRNTDTQIGRVWG
jgi:hypothetical protein